MKVLLVDDHALFAKSLAVALEDFPEIERFISTKDIQHLPDMIQTEKPDILLMDINLGNMTESDGLLLAKDILKMYPTQKIIILSGYNLPVYRKEAKKIGMKGFISKDIEPEDLMRTLKDIHNGALSFPQEKMFIEDLTISEKQILSLVASGMKRKDIADQLFLSERTVSNHLQHIFEKLQVTSTVEAVTKAIQMGYITPVFTDIE